uniref:Ankyrin repeat domain 2 (stretch responsive muscle) n=1 Tax=Myripristis murdjan TaxID=586833 RepID=A0A667XZK1_9TELE
MIISLPNIGHVISQAEEIERRISSDLTREILDLGGLDNITEMCKRKTKKTKRKSSSQVYVELPVVGPVDPEDFMDAAIKGKLKVVEKYLADGGNPNFHDELKRTALHRASIEGHSAIVQMLLEKGADVHFKDKLDSMAIHWACRGGSLTVVAALKNHGVDLNVRDKLYSTPLHVATRTGQTDIVDYLLSSGVKINARDREGDTALHDAVRLNRYKIVKLLVVAGADTTIKNHVKSPIMCPWLNRHIYVGRYNSALYHYTFDPVLLGN